MFVGWSVGRGLMRFEAGAAALPSGGVTFSPMDPGKASGDTMHRQSLNWGEPRSGRRRGAMSAMDAFRRSFKLLCQWWRAFVRSGPLIELYGVAS